MVVVKLFSSLCRKNLRGRMSDHFSLDQFYNKDELFTSFSLMQFLRTCSFLACGMTY